MIRHAIADGPSRVVLLTLPDYQEPYALTIKSYQFKRAFSEITRQSWGTVRSPATAEG